MRDRWIALALICLMLGGFVLIPLQIHPTSADPTESETNLFIQLREHDTYSGYDPSCSEDLTDEEAPRTQIRFRHDNTPQDTKGHGYIFFNYNATELNGTFLEWEWYGQYNGDVKVIVVDGPDATSKWQRANLTQFPDDNNASFTVLQTLATQTPPFSQETLNATIDCDAATTDWVGIFWVLNDTTLQHFSARGSGIGIYYIILYEDDTKATVLEYENFDVASPTQNRRDIHWPEGEATGGGQNTYGYWWNTIFTTTTAYSTFYTTAYSSWAHTSYTTASTTSYITTGQRKGHTTTTTDTIGTHTTTTGSTTKIIIYTRSVMINYTVSVAQIYSVSVTWLMITTITAIEPGGEIIRKDAPNIDPTRTATSPEAGPQTLTITPYQAPQAFEPIDLGFFTGPRILLIGLLVLLLVGVWLTATRAGKEAKRRIKWGDVLDF